MCLLFFFVSLMRKDVYVIATPLSRRLHLQSMSSSMSDTFYGGLHRWTSLCTPLPSSRVTRPAVLFRQHFFPVRSLVFRHRCENRPPSVCPPNRDFVGVFSSKIVRSIHSSGHRFVNRRAVCVTHVSVSFAPFSC